MAGRFQVALLAAATLMAAGAAKADVIDFDSAPNNVASMTIDGVTFTPDGVGMLFTSGFGNTPDGTPGLLAFDGVANFPATRADISGGTNFVSVDLGDFDGDDDSLFLKAFDSLNNLLGSASLFYAESDVGMRTLTVSVAGIDHVTFGGVGVEGSSVYADNFTFNGGGGVPEPAAWALMLAGFGLAGATLRRRTAIA